MVRLSPLVAVLFAVASLSCGCGAPTGKGINRDRDRPLPEKEPNRPEALAAEEARVRDLVRELYGPHIQKETITRADGDTILNLSLRDEKRSSLDVNLSRLARKHRQEGLSLAAIKADLKLDDGK
jgi:hypothetical protein